ncbi:low molecular weight phosphatase family protein [Jiangella ureilytica]|uniref:Low molecular weight phosphatase family protein n=1 Tax=Jiangella ureilytica TaxID=2530374 RepID=A0A4R4RGA5_9ACTN|nr:low molecular weight phosphatase family protein [Jiangella ureilytica]TDC48377.1 low molecular weight phosphatase family protein [Jiangella ureilytica]
MSTPTTGVPGIDRDLALRLAGERLGKEFTGIGRETIDQFLETSYEHFAAGARIPTFVPLMAERFSRQRLRALARVEREQDKPTVLFLDPDNAGRSLLALGLFEELSGDGALGWSGGAEPALDVDDGVTEAMRERSIDLGDEFPKPWTEEIIQAADVVVIMGGVAVPELPGQRYEHWDVPETAGRDLDGVRAVRDGIEEKVRDLLTRLGVGVSA